MEVEEKFSDTDKIQFILVPKREPNDEECVKNVKSSWPPREESTCNEDHREPITEKVKDENQHMSQDFNILVDDLLKDSANPNSDVKVKSEQDTEEPEENFQDLVESRVAEPNPSDYEISTPQETVESESDSSESHSPKRKRRNTTSKTLPVVAATSNEIQSLSSDSDSEEVQSEGGKCTAQLNGVLCECVKCNKDFNILVDDLLKDSANPNSDVRVESEPDTEEPEDNVQDLVESRDAEPNPSDTESNLSDAERNPSDDEPNPSDTEPNPSDAEPDPSNAERNPSNAEPNPSHAEPNPSNAETNPSHAEPNPSNAERDPSNAEPDPSCAEPDPSDDEISTIQETVESESDSSESHSPKRKRRNTTSKTLPVVAATSNEIQTLSSDSDSEEDFNILVDDLLKGSANSNSDVIVESEPDTEEPEDNVQDLVESWDAEPNPSDTESNLSDAERNPSDAEPNPSDTEPNPSDAEPDPSNAERNPSNAEPNPSHAEPNPSNAETNPSHAEPNPSNAERDPSNAEPDPSCAEPDPSDDEISTIQETVESGSDHGESHCPKRKRRNTTSKTLPVVAATSNDIQTLSSDSDSEEVQSEGGKCTAQLNGVLCECVKCKKAFDSEVLSNGYKKNTGSLQEFLECALCAESFCKFNVLKSHILNVHSGGLKKNVCPIC
ncbi:cell surface glycoprotein 1-like isoform X3 [Macrosteles quadrilineatus]|uniref:cell surface glycoprotein 1-like isoform X3 n=1 Tax=Macrosteles quadrilineatus TaxID=74068 RepID=UPI0023E17E60|nr:cell surface glycoprotein 1-like isoform X3 [Macrosteles quadrilineatus]